MKASLLIILSLLFIASCGKKVIKKTYPAKYADAAFVEDIELFMPELKALFSEELITDHFSDDADLLFIETRLKNGESFFGKNFVSLTSASTCSTCSIRPNSPILLTVSTKACLNPISETITPYPGSYSLDLNPVLKEALDSNPDRVAVREVIYEGEVYVGFGIQKDSGFNLSKSYKEYLVVPDFPMILNPVLTYDSETGEVRALKGIQVKDSSATVESSESPAFGAVQLE